MRKSLARVKAASGAERSEGSIEARRRFRTIEQRATVNQHVLKPEQLILLTATPRRA
jgi:hypothetical protein